MSDVDSAFPYDPEQGLPDEVSGSFDPLDGPRVVVLLGGERGESDGWAPRAALGLVREWSREGRKMVVVDVGLEAPALHALLGEENGEGVSDMVLYGASVQRVACRPDGERFVLIPAGTPVMDVAPVLEHPRWGTILAGFRDAGADLALYVPATLPGVDRLLPHATLQVLLGDDAGTALDPGGEGARVLNLTPPPVTALEDRREDLLEEPVLQPEPDPTTPEASSRGPTAGVPDSDDGWVWADPWGLPASEAPPESGLQVAPEPEPALVREPASEPGAAAERPPELPPTSREPVRRMAPSAAPQRVPAPTPREPVRRREVRQPAVSARPTGAGPVPPPAGETPSPGIDGTPAPAPAAVEPGKRPGPVGMPTARAPRRTGLWVLVLLLIILAAVLGAARLGYLDVPGVTPSGGGPSLPAGLTTANAATLPPGVLALPVAERPGPDVGSGSMGAPSPPGGAHPRGSAPSIPAATGPGSRATPPRPTTPPHAMSLALNAYSTPWGARRGAEAVRAALPDHPVVVAPVTVRGRLFYRLAITGAVDPEAAEALRRVAVPAFPAGDPAEWFVRTADRGFLLEETTSLGDARARAEGLEARDLPAYILEVPLSDGTRVWRVHAGAYATDGEAAAMASLLERTGEGTPPLVPLTGLPPE